MHKTKNNLKKTLGIKKGNIVFGCHGGESSFDIRFVQDVLKKIVAEIRRYLDTDVTPNEKNYFQSKIAKYEKIISVTDDHSKQDLKSFIHRNEKLFDKVGYFDRLWPEFSFLTA